MVERIASLPRLYTNDKTHHWFASKHLTLHFKKKIINIPFIFTRRLIRSWAVIHDVWERPPSRRSTTAYNKWTPRTIRRKSRRKRVRDFKLLHTDNLFKDGVTYVHRLASLCLYCSVLLVLSTLSITILFGSSKYFPLVNLVVSVLYFILFCEHDYVVRNSYPVVWSQPEFTETCKYAVGIMEKAKFRSRLFLFFYVIVFFYNGFWTLAAFDLLPKWTNHYKLMPTEEAKELKKDIFNF